MSRVILVGLLVLGAVAPLGAQEFIRGDANGSGGVDLVDALFVLRYLFVEGQAPECVKAADANDSGSVNIADPVYVLRYQFLGGAAMPPPFPAAGLDPTPDDLPCGAGGLLRIDEARFVNREARLNRELIVQGVSDLGKDVLIRDDVSRALVATVTPNAAGDWELSIKNLTYVPCRVRAESGGLFDAADVASAPDTCGFPDALPPVCEISAPAGPIDVGTPVTFTGRAVDPEGQSMIAAWHFGGAIDASVVREVASGEEFSDTVTFDQGGQAFRITLTVTDSQDLRALALVTIVVGTPPDAATSRDPVPEHPAPGNPEDQDYTVLAFNDLGMHCEDYRSLPFLILPPYNVLNAVVLERGDPPQLLDDTGGVELRYSAAANPSDVVIGNAALEPPSINSTAANDPPGTNAEDADIAKSDFWDAIDAVTSVVEAIFGLDIPLDEGLPTVHNVDGVGRRMPGILDPYVVNDRQPFSTYRTDRDWFTAEGIPVSSIDDFGRMNAYPLLRVEALISGSDVAVAAVDAVVPVSTEVDCRDCHVRGAVGADPAQRPDIAFVDSKSPGNRADDEIAAKMNIMRLHDFTTGSTLELDQPVICAGCHNSYALEEATGGGLAGDPKRNSMSRAMHGYHGMLKTDAGTGALLRDDDGNPLTSLELSAGEARLIPVDPDDPFVTMEDNCFTCHPGKLTQCFRGAMFNAGLECSDCHGDMIATAGLRLGDFDGTGVLRSRLPWRDEPRCESCHQGDAVDPGPAAMLLRRSYAADDLAAVALLAPNPRFAEEPGEIYRNSHGHGGVPCEGCHGSPHAIWPVPDPLANDNVAAIQLQGHAGPILECSVCHTAGSFPDGTLDGPHGMHPVADPQWIKGDGGDWHGDYAEIDGGVDPCASCHGEDHRGTRLSRTPIDRELRDGEGKLRAVVRAGETISCDLCHSLDKSFED